MTYDIWIVEAGSPSSFQQIRRLLDGHRMTVVTLNELASMNGRETHPEALVVVTDSWRAESRQQLEVIAQIAHTLPVIVIDDSFDTNTACYLAKQGVQEYLAAGDLTADELATRIRFAVIRKKHQSVRNLQAWFEAHPDLNMDTLRATARSLPPCEREIFALLPACLSTEEMADQLEKSAQTVRNQITTLKQQFGVDSREELIIISILGLAKTK